MIKAHINAKQTPDSNIESLIFQCLQRVHNTGPVTLALQHTHTYAGVSIFHRIPMHHEMSGLNFHQE